MSGALAGAAFLMGLAGGSHCLVMCAAPCRAAVVAMGHGEVLLSPTRRHSARLALPSSRAFLFHAGRLLGYAILGSLAAFAMESLAWLTQSAWSLRPLWTFAHVGMLFWGMVLIVQAQQPAWIESAGRAVWRRVLPLVRSSGGVFSVGFLWALMPCGLLYSALLLAALSSSPVQGAWSMLCFAIGSGIWLWMGPWVWGQAKARLNGWRAEWGTRVAGLMLLSVAAWALWMDLVYKPSLWCR